MDRSPPGSSVHGIFQARVLERVTISFFRAFSLPRHGTHVSCLGRQILYHCTSWEQRERFISGLFKENGWPVLRNPGLQGKVFIGKIWVEGCRECNFLLIALWWGNRACSRNLVFSLNLSSSTWRVGQSSSRKSRKYCTVYPLRGTQDSPRSCIIFSWLFLLWFYITSHP